MPQPHAAPISGASRVWLITGASRGLGRAFASAALDAGDRVVGVVRDPAALDGLVAEHPGALLAVQADVRDRNAVVRAIGEAVAWAGRLDVVVNNAGYGLVGAAEEASEAEVRAHLDTNLLGPLWVCQAVIPQLRAQGSGHIVQVSTTGAVGSMPTLGLYNAGKWGLEGWSEALATELAPFGIRVTIAELGGFATDWAGSSMRFASPQPQYDELRTRLFGSPEVPWPTAADAEPAAEGGDDPEGSDPAVAAAALLAHLDRPDGPLRLLVGDDAPEQVAMALDARRTDYARDARFSWPAS